MKSIFLFILVLTATMATAFAQMTMRPSPQDMKVNEKRTFDKFYERLKIGWFAVPTTPHLDDIMKGQYHNAAISPEFGNAPKGDQKNHDTWPTNIWQQISFRYSFGAKMDFVVNPRFMVPIVNSRDMKAPEDRSFIMVDDILFGFQGVVLSDEAKKFNLWIRPGMRVPTSRPSRNSGQGGAGTLSNQVELAYNATYDFTKIWQVGLFGQWRSWVIEDQVGFDRFRIYTAPFIQYTVDDVSRWQLYYENMLETNRRSKPADDRDPVFKDVWQNAFLGYSRDFTPKFNAMPFVSVFVNDEPITDKSIWFGAWVSYQIK